MISLVRRAEPSRSMVYFAPLLALVLTILVGAGLFTLLGVNPILALHAFFIEPISDFYGLTEWTVKAAPLVLIGVPLALGFRAGIWNIGAEGQLTIGALCGGAVALAFYEQEGLHVLPSVLLAGVAGGMAWAALVAYLRTHLNVNEILSSLMLTYVATLLLSYMVHGPLKDPDGFNFPESRIFSESALLPTLIDGYRLHLGFVFALLTVVIGWFILSRTLLGFKFQVMGDAPEAARYAGYSRNKIVWISLLLSGGAAGLAGVGEVAGPIGQLLPSISPGYGFTAIIVAYVGRLHPVGALLSGLLLALSYLGGETAQIRLGLPLAVTGVFQGCLLFFLLACDVLILYRVKWHESRHREVL